MTTLIHVNVVLGEKQIFAGNLDQLPGIGRLFWKIREYFIIFEKSGESSRFSG